MTDIPSLTASSGFWEVVAEIGFALVIIGVIGEGISEWPPSLIRDWPRLKQLGRVSWFVLVAGLAGEFGAQHIKSSADALVIESMHGDNLELEQQIQPRRLDDAQIKVIVAALSKFQGQQIDVCRYLESESSRLTSKLEMALVAAGWHINEYQQLSAPVASVVSGLLVEVDPTSSRDGAAASALALVLKQSKLDTDGPVSPIPPDAALGATWGRPIYKLRLTVGLKP